MVFSHFPVRFFRKAASISINYGEKLTGSFGSVILTHLLKRLFLYSFVSKIERPILQHALNMAHNKFKECKKTTYGNLLEFSIDPAPRSSIAH